MSRVRRFLLNLMPVVVDHGAFERFVMRLALAVTVFYTIRWGLPPYDDQPKPNGLAHFIDLTFLTDKSVMGPLQAITIACLVLYVLRIVPVIAVLVPFAVSVGVGTLINSQGAINHDTQMVTMILLGQCIVFLVAGIRAGQWLRIDSLWENRAILVSKIVIAAGYVASGMVKLDRSDGRWIHDVPKLAVQLRKTNLSKFSSDGLPIDEFGGVVFPAWIIEHPWLARGLFGSGLLLELLCFVALAGRRSAFVIGVLLIVLHLTVGRLMELHFVYNMAAIAIFFVNVPGIPKMLRGRLAAGSEPLK